MFTLTEVCRELSISPATGRNWIKLGKIKAEGKRGSAYVFSDEYVQRLKDELKSGGRSALKSRRNKSFISGKALYRDYISSKSVNIPAIESLISSMPKDEVCPPDLCRAIIANCAVSFAMQKMELNSTSFPLKSYLEGSIDLDGFGQLIDDYIGSAEDLKNYISTENIPDDKFVYEPGEDILGLLYISLKNINTRKKSGAYYTPTTVVKRLLGHLFEASLMTDGQNKSLLDPCCGTGNFLLQLPPGIPKENIYGSDIDVDSVLIARINLALKYNYPSYDFWKKQLCISDFLLGKDSFSDESFDIVFGNPPWGYSFSPEENELIKEGFETATIQNPESCDLFLERAIKRLTPGGIVSFVTPQSILTVKSHSPIRTFILRSTCLSHLEYIGEVFDRVQCPSIILQLKKCAEIQEYFNPANCSFVKDSPKIYEHDRNFTIGTERAINPDCFDFLIPDEEYLLLKKLDESENNVTLKDNAIFALGIVTGANKEMLKTRKSSTNEIILKGSDIFRFSFKTPKCYITFKPEMCQQVASTEYYRAPVKLLYRFIGNHLVFAYDDKQTLSLNSCNIVIPQISGLDIKYICAVLNSRICDYYFRKKFRSVKVLRSHIETLPIPYTDEAVQKEIAGYVDEIRAAESGLTELYDKIDNRLKELYGLSDEEYGRILSDLSEENQFLMY